METELICPLCGHSKTSFLDRHQIARLSREFYQCSACRLIYVPKRFHVSISDEKSRYDQHENSIHQQGYLDFLNRLARPLSKRLTPGAVGLDAGCGPGPALKHLLEQAGYRMDLYDPYYFPDRPSRTYDFVTCTEVVEHLRDPKYFFHQVDGWLKPGGLFAVMTQFYDGKQPISQWWYTKDPTHINFYTPDSLRWIAQTLGWTAEFPDQNLVFFRKS